MDTSPPPVEAPPTRDRALPPTTWLLLGLLLVLCGVALARQLLRHPKQPESQEARLHGDSDSATGALDEVLNKTPPDQRLAVLLKDTQDPSPGLRYAAIDALGSEHTPAVEDAIERGFTDSFSRSRESAMLAMIKVDPERGLRLLLTGLVDEDDWVRDTAATELALFLRQHPTYGRRAVPMLIQTLDDPDPVLPLTNMNVLRTITKQPWHIKHGTPPAEKQAMIQHWKTWWAQEQPHWNVPPEYVHIAPVRPTRTDPAPDFHLQDIDGNAISLDSQRGKVTLLNFWGTWCPPCQVETPALVQLDNTYRGRGLDIIGIALGEDSADTLRRWCKAHNITYRQALSTEEVQEAYGHVEEVPVSVLLDKQGRVRYWWEAERDYGTFSAAVARLVQE